MHASVSFTASVGIQISIDGALVLGVSLVVSQSLVKLEWVTATATCIGLEHTVVFCVIFSLSGNESWWEHRALGEYAEVEPVTEDSKVRCTSFNPQIFTHCLIFSLHGNGISDSWGISFEWNAESEPVAGGTRVSYTSWMNIHTQSVEITAWFPLLNLSLKEVSANDVGSSNWVECTLLLLTHVQP